MGIHGAESILYDRVPFQIDPSGGWLTRRIRQFLLPVAMALLIGPAASDVTNAGVSGMEVPGIVYQLLPTGGWQVHRAAVHARADGYGLSLAPAAHVAVYMADVLPGARYDLGLRLQRDLNTRIAVAVYDRPPWMEAARRYDLPMGPVVRTASPEVEYRWHIGIAPDSEGRRMYITVELDPGAPGSTQDAWYAIYLARALRRPMDRLGRGVTYLPGPRNLELAGSGKQRVVVVAPGPLMPDGVPVVPGWTPNLVHNGDFHRGLEGWTLLPEGSADPAERVVIDGNGLVLRGGREMIGVRQILQRKIVPGRPVMLHAMIRLQREKPDQDRASMPPLELRVCYLDEKDGEHCGSSAWRRRFVMLGMDQGGRDTVRIPAGVWYAFDDDLGKAIPKPSVITRIEILGGANPGASAQVLKVRLFQP